MEQTAELPKPKPPNRWWWAWLVLACFLMLVIAASATNLPSNSAEHAGYATGQALLVWGMYVLLAARRTSATAKGVSFFAILAMSLVGSMAAKGRASEETKAAMAGVHSDFSKMMKSSTDEKGFPTRIDTKIDTTPKAKGDMGEVERFMKSHLARLAAQRNAYLAELEAAGWDRILDPRRLGGDAGMAESRAIVKKARGIVAKHRAASYAILQNAKSQIANLNVGQGTKDDMLRGYEKGLARSMPVMDEIWNLEEQIFGKFDSMVELLARDTKAWTVREGKLLFLRKADMTEFNEHFTRMEQLTAVQQAVQKKSTDQTNENLLKLSK